VHDVVLDDRRMKVREIAETIGISKERERYILHEELDMKKLYPRWVPWGILQILRRTTTGTRYWRWSIAGINVLVLREITLKNKNNFEIINSFFYC
jgi:hypothetical protein